MGRQFTYKTKKEALAEQKRYRGIADTKIVTNKRKRGKTYTLFVELHYPG